MKANKSLIVSAIITTSMLSACGGSKTETTSPTTKPSVTVTPSVDLYKSVSCKDMLSAGNFAILTPGSSCGYLTVPEKHPLYGQPATTKNIEIAVIKLAAIAVNKQQDPVVYLQGGPGGSASSSIAEIVATATFINQRDVYLVDQRGTGHSKPALSCTEYDGEAGTPAQVKACKTRLEQSGVDLNAYHSVHNALDFILLRQALEIPQWNIYGISYGTRLATTIMRENSEGIRSVILDGMFPIEVNGISDTPWANYQTLNQIIKNCDNSNNCPAPEFKALIDDITARMHNVDMVAESRVFIQNLLKLATNPAIISYLLAGDQDINTYTSALAALMPVEEGDDAQQDIFYSAMALSTICAEEYPFLNITDLANDNSQGWSQSTQLTVNSMHHMGFDKASCQAWNVAPANDIETQAVASSLPVLILNGQNDPQTPAAWGALVAKNIPHAQNITNPQGGHGQLFTGVKCFDTLAQQFLTNPNQDLDTSCVTDIDDITYAKKSTSSPFSQAFSKKTSVFGIPIYGTTATPDESMLHAVNVMAQYLDNNQDGEPDNQLVVDHMIEQGATLIMTKDQSELESLSATIPQSNALQDLYASEVVIGNDTPGRFYATIEEVLHLITHIGYAGVYPQVFGEAIGSEIANAMDIARGGQFTTIPANYPANAWYRYDDTSCDYSCMVTEYTYWSLTSILGAQNADGRLAQITNEWLLNTREKVQAQDNSVYKILTNGQYSLATQLPDGNYLAKQFIISTITPDSSNLPDKISATKVVTNGTLSFELQFINTLRLQGNVEQEWTAEQQQPFIDASNQWLSALVAVEGKSQHTITMKIHVKHLAGGNGQAGPDSQEQVGTYLIPTSGEMVIANHTYVTGFDPVEFHANILHEMGHIIGIGSFTQPYVSNDPSYKGNVFRVPASKAVAMYNQIYGTNFDFVPFSDDEGHLYDYILQQDKQRILDNGDTLPPLTQEFMANGSKFGQVTLAVLDDIGYEVDYSNAEHYTP